MSEHKPTLATPIIGEPLKVWLPGESPWVIVLAVLEDGRILGRLSNDLLAIGHGYKFGDVATFEPEVTHEFAVWKLCDLGRQLKIGPSALPTAR